MEKTIAKIKAFKQEFFGSGSVGGLASGHLLFANPLTSHPLIEAVFKGFLAVCAAVASGVLTVMFTDFYKQVVRKRLYKHFQESKDDEEDKT